MNHIHFTYELCNSHDYSIVFKIILTRRVPTVDPITILIALKGSYNCVIAQFIAHVITYPSAGGRRGAHWCVFQGRKMHGVATNVYSRKMSKKPKRVVYEL